jgi:hypothetical protein
MGAATQLSGVPRPLFLAATHAMYTTFDYRGRPVIRRAWPSRRETRVPSYVRALTLRERDRLVISLNEKSKRAA